MEKIDDLDRKILTVITQNARIPFKDVADMCGVSRAAIHQRVQKMYDNGVILGSGYQVNPKMLGYQMCSFVGIRLENENTEEEMIRALMLSHLTAIYIKQSLGKLSMGCCVKMKCIHNIAVF